MIEASSIRHLHAKMTKYFQLYTFNYCEKNRILKMTSLNKETNMKLTKTLLTTAILGFSLASCHSTGLTNTPDQQLDQGFEAVKKGDYQTALKLWKPLADQGDARAQYNLGLMYRNGNGIQDDVEAAKWFRKAAENGDVKAQHNLGMMYTKGEGVEQDYAEAVKWYRKAADQGGLRSQYSLGVMYYNGVGVKQDYVEAAKWYRKAADKGYTMAQFNLGLMYRDGEGVKQNRTVAKEWLGKACDNGDKKGCLYYKKLK